MLEPPPTPPPAPDFERPKLRPVLVGSLAGILPVLAYSVLVDLSFGEAMLAIAAVYVIVVETITAKVNIARVDAAIASFESATGSVERLREQYLVRFTSLATAAQTLIDSLKGLRRGQ